MKRHGAIFFLCTLYLYPADLYKTVEAMTLQEKIGQLFVVATTASFGERDESLASAPMTFPYRMEHEYIAQLIETYHIGGLIFLYKGTPDEQLALTQRFQQMSTIPLLICEDSEYGLSMRLRGVLRYPRAMTLGAIRNKQLIYEYGRELARQCKLIGVHMNLAPVVDCNTNPANPVIHMRSFGQEASEVAQCASLMIRGLQDGGVAACAKHFPGHGDTSVDSHLALPCVMHDCQRLEAVELYPFKAAIREGVAALMTAHLLVPAYDTQFPASLSYTVTTELIKKRLSFAGLVISDGLGMHALAPYAQPGERELRAFSAGNDILLCPLDVPAAVARIQDAIASGEVPLSRLDDAVCKIMSLKKQYHVTRDVPVVHDLYEQLHTSYARALKKELFAQAITLHADRPLRAMKQSERVCVVQCGSTSESPFTQSMRAFGADTYYMGPDTDMQQQIEICRNYETVVIALLDMNQIAVRRYGISMQTDTFIKQLCAVHDRVIIVFFGTPYSVRLYEQLPTIIVGYEDDEDAQEAVVEVLYGKRLPTGKLPVTVL